MSNSKFSEVSDSFLDWLMTEIAQEESIARDTSDKRVLSMLARKKELKVRIFVAANEETSPDDLYFLAMDGNPRVRCAVASNPKAPEKILLVLTKDEDVRVRLGVAENENASKKILSKLAEDEDEGVRYAVEKKSISDEGQLDCMPE